MEPADHHRVVHASILDLLVNLLASVPLGLVLERSSGRRLPAAYLTAGLFSVCSCVGVSSRSRCGAAGAVAGVYAFMLAALLGISQRPRLVLPRLAINGLAVCGGLFFADAWLTGAAAVVVVGFATGLFAGLTVSRGVNTRRTPAVVWRHGRDAVVRGDCHGGPTPRDHGCPARHRCRFRDRRSHVGRVQDGARGIHRRPHDRAGAGCRHRPGDRAGDPLRRSAAGSRRPATGASGPAADLAAAKEYLTLRDESWTVRANALRGGKMSIL